MAVAVLLAFTASAATLAPPRPAGSSAPADATDWDYRVLPGDTLVGIAARHLVPGQDWPGLARHNQLADPARLKPGSLLHIPQAWLRHDPSGAEVLHLNGEVQRLGVAHSGPLLPGDRLLPGDLIETGPRGSVTLRFVDGARLLLTPGSRLRIERAGEHSDSRSTETRVRVDRGSAETQVDPLARVRRRFEISTPVVNLGVRGTDFRTHAGDGDSRVEVLSGQVAAGQALAIDAGFGIVALPGQPLSAPLRLAPAPDLSAVPQRLDRLPLHLPWAAVPGAQGYRAQVWTLGDAAQPVLDGRFVEPAATWAQLPDGPYQLRVRVIDSQGLEGLDARVPLRLLTQPPAPTPLLPAPGARERHSRVTLRWAAVAGSTGYRLQLARVSTTPPAAEGSAWAQPPVDVMAGAETATQIDLAPGTYQWRLASRSAQGEQGPFGDVQSFSVQPLPPAPQASAPQAQAGQVAWRWQPTGPGDRYEVQVSHDAGFVTPMQTRVLAGTQVLLPLAEPGRYALRLRAISPDGQAGPHSALHWVDVAPPRWPPGRAARAAEARPAAEPASAPAP